MNRNELVHPPIHRRSRWSLEGSQEIIGLLGGTS